MTANKEEKNGHTPLAGQADGGASSRHLAESLYETYLTARLARARRGLKRAKVALLRDPRNTEKLGALRRAEDEMEKLQAQRLEQERDAAEETIPGFASATPDFRTAQAARADQTHAASAGPGAVAERLLTEEQPAAPHDKGSKYKE